MTIGDSDDSHFYTYQKLVTKVHDAARGSWCIQHTQLGVMSNSNLIAIFFVNSSSGGGNLVFRYPPHPRSQPRLSKPIYGKKHKLAPKSVKPNGNVSDKPATPSDGECRREGIETGISQATEWAHAKTANEVQEEESDDDFGDDIETAFWKPIHTGPLDVENHNSTPPRRPAPRRHPSMMPPGGGADAAPKPETSQTTSPKSSRSLNIKNLSSNNSGTSFDVQDYETCLGYELPFLNAFLSPQRSLCNRKFQVVVDDLAFIGHPVCADEEGNWRYPDHLDGTDTMDDDDEQYRRGRTGGLDRSRAASRNGMSGTNGKPNGLEKVDEADDEHGDVQGEQSKNQNSRNRSTSSQDAAEDPLPPLNSFHLVLVVDKPDPVMDEEAPDNFYESLYREVAFKWTAAAFDQQVESGWVQRECKKINQVRDYATSKRESGEHKASRPPHLTDLALPLCFPLQPGLPVIPIRQAQAEAFAISPLAMSLRTIYHSILQQTTAHIYVGKLPLDICLPIKPPVVREEWTRWGENVSDWSDSSSSASTSADSDDESDGTISDTETELGSKRWEELEIKPWKTLLPLQNLKNLKGDGPLDQNGLPKKSNVPTVELAMSSANTFSESVQAERDARELTQHVRRFLSVLDPSLP